ncbi:MAG TPA: Wzt carbohydrate-binding domain-containing protein, partial [Terriglobia bacterium]|nr:Wzt carbohydrate-binding domain-containing protein [Terriglobia bacterium]
LKILSRITEPSAGFAEIRGRVASLLEVGTGFHAELSGRENIFLNGAILGMKKAEIVRKFDDIVEFAEVGQFIDTPVKHYSSGMYVRLAFAVAAHLEPEILLVDEVLAVGDVGFQRKCLGKMEDVARGGRTILFVSHNMSAVESLCSRAVILDQNRIVCNGSTTDVIASYLSSFPMAACVPLSERTDRRGDGSVIFTNIELASGTLASTQYLQSGQDVQVSVDYTSPGARLRNVELYIELYAQSGQCMLTLNNEMAGASFDSIPASGRLTCRIKRFPLSPGEYYITLFGKVNGRIADWVQHAALVTVEGGDFFGSGRLPARNEGGCLVLQEWNVQQRKQYQSVM